MRKVKFRLQPVLAHRKRVEERLQMELASLSREYFREEQALPMLKRSLEQQMGELSRLQGAAVLDLAAIELGLAALGRTEASIEQQQVLLKRLSEEMEEKREELIQAMKKCKALPIYALLPIWAANNRAHVDHIITKREFLMPPLCLFTISSP